MGAERSPSLLPPAEWPDPINVTPVPPRVKSIAFQASLTERGSQVQTFDYAYYARKLLGLRVIILHGGGGSNATDNTSQAVLSRWGAHFEIKRTLGPPDQIGSWLRGQGCYDIYICLHGKRGGPGTPTGLIDGLMRAGVRVHLHAIFYAAVPWGSTFARVGAAVRGKSVPVVPLIVRPGEPSGSTLRQSLGIADDATVFCRYGGSDTFNIGFVHSVVDRVSKQWPKLFFLFLNTASFCEKRPNVIHLPAVVRPVAKSRFIRTCDAMLHARADGETFGLSVAEFSSHNKPVLTYCPLEVRTRNHSSSGGEGWHQAVGRRKYQVWFEHVRLLGSKALLYADAMELEKILVTFNRTEASLRNDWNAYAGFAPETVIGQFSAVFLQGSRDAGGGADSSVHAPSRNLRVRHGAGRAVPHPEWAPNWCRRYDCFDYANLQDRTAMDTLASEVKQQADAIAARTGVLPAAVVGFSDYVYRDAFDNWINAARNVAFSVPAFVALDNRTAAHFDRANVPVAPGDLYLKTFLTLVMLDAGLRVIFSEMDIFWLADPFLIEDPSVDIQVSQQGYGDGGLNFGFWIAQPTRGARGLFERISNFAASPAYFPCLDNFHYDYAVRGSEIFGLCHRHTGSAVRSANVTLAKLMLRDEEGGGPRWKHIPLQLLPHPFKWSGSRPNQPPFETVALGNAIAVHLWRTVSGLSPAMRIWCAKAHGWWTLPQAEAPRVAPFVTKKDVAWPSENYFHAQAENELLARIARLEARLHPHLRQEARVRFRPAQHQLGKWNEGMDRNLTRVLDAWAAYPGPGGRCANGMAIWQLGSATTPPN